MCTIQSLSQICWITVNKSNVEGFFKIVAVLLVCFVQSITVQIESVLQSRILLILITLANKSFENLTSVGKVCTISFERPEASHWKKLTCSTICRKHGISVELVWNHENSILIPYRGSFKFHNTYAETGYKLWN